VSLSGLKSCNLPLELPVELLSAFPVELLLVLLVLPVELLVELLVSSMADSVGRRVSSPTFRLLSGCWWNSSRSALGLLRRTALERRWNSRWSTNSAQELLGELLCPTFGHHCEVLTRPEVRCTHCGWARGWLVSFQLPSQGLSTLHLLNYG